MANTILPTANMSLSEMFDRAIEADNDAFELQTLRAMLMAACPDAESVYDAVAKLIVARDGKQTVSSPTAVTIRPAG